MSITEKFESKSVLIWGYGIEGKSTEGFLKKYCKPSKIEIFEGKEEELKTEGFDYIIKSPGIPGDYPDEKFTSQTELFLEEFREDFVRRYSEDISNQLPITSSYGEIYDNPKDVELGTLKFMADERRLFLSSPEYERLRIFKEARNNLSHLAVLSINEIRELGI